MSRVEPTLSKRPATALQSLADGWNERVGASRARAEAFGLTALLFGGFLLARRGTVTARGGAVAGAIVVAVVLLWTHFQESELWNDPVRVIGRLAGRVDPERAGRAIRALGLTAEPPRPGTSEALARLHVERSVEALPRDRIFDRAARIGFRYTQLSVVFAIVALGLAATRGFSLYEGLDVLVARNHVAPLPVLWLDALEVGARPPDYLHLSERELYPYGAMALPRGTVLTYRGIETHAGRHLLLTDGTNDVPFVDDGEGHVTARWTLAESVTLRVVARFGQVDIREAEAAVVTSIADEVPVVTLETAPRVIKLAEVGLLATIPIKYEASDDHGLREIQLVLRSAGHENRRTLARLDGETQDNRGGSVLRANDPFLAKSHAPIEATVEAKDNDPLTGPKWGTSAALTIIPPEAGEPEALRLAGLLALRDRFVDTLAAQLTRVFPVAASGRAELAAADAAEVHEDEAALETLAKGVYAGIAVPRRIVALLRVPLRRVKETLKAELRSPGSASHARLVAASERLVLVTDAVLRGAAQHDARKVALALADVADELAMGLGQMQRSEERERGETKADGSVVVLGGGGRSLRQLGVLGHDLGEIVGVDLDRVARAREQGDLVHAEIAANDLATRLKTPDPSFGAQGSSGGRAGTESGGQKSAGDGDASDEAESAFDQAAQALGKLSSDHAEELSKVEQAADAPDGEEPAAREEGKEHARAVREATRGLPSVGAGSDSWTNKGATAREQAEAMARALEEGNAREAVANGKSALDALDEARNVAQRERWMGSSPVDRDDERSADSRLTTARQKLEPEVKAAENRLAAQQRRAKERRAPELSARGDEEQRLAERAGSLGGRGDEGPALPEAALEALHQAERAAEEAASALKRGDLEQGLAQQREAQRRLEAAKTALGTDGNEDGGGPNGDHASSGHAEIPQSGAHKGPEDFRHRVLEGLGQASGGRQKDAIRRYADQLLR